MSSARLLVRGARLPGRDDLADLLIEDGRFRRVDPHVRHEIAPGLSVLEAHGRLALPPFVDAHMHLDSALTFDPADPNHTGTLLEGIEVWGRRRAQLTGAEILANARKVLRWMIAAGTLYVRCHVDVSPGAPDALSGLLELREEARGVCDLQLVAFPQDGLYRAPGQLAALRSAMERGCDAVGGIPHHERGAADGEAHVQALFDLAQEYDADIDAHCDESDDPNSRFAASMAREAIRRGWQGRVVLGHCTALAAYETPALAEVAALLAEAGVGVVANPMVNAVLQGRGDAPPVRRGMAPIAALLRAGVEVGLGQDSVLDAWLPLGTGDMLAVAQFGALFGHLTGYEQLIGMLDLITCAGARLLRLGERYGIEPGRPADFVLLDARDPIEALRLVPARPHVFRNGREVARTDPARARLSGSFAPGELGFGRG